MFRHRRLATLASSLAIGALAMLSTSAGAASPAPPVSAAPSGAPVASPGAATTAMVRFIHASPDAPAVDVYVSGTRFDANTDFAFGVISDYQPIAAGAQTLTVYPAGSDTATAKPLITKDLTLTAGQRYTLAATNELAKLEATVIKDDPAPTADKAQVRVVHLSADTSGVDILPSGKDTALFSGVTYPNATDYKTVDPGVATFDVRNMGTTTVALTSSPIDLQAGDSTSIFAIGSSAAVAGAQPLRLLVAIDDSVNTRMRFLNAAPDAAAVDVWVDGAKVDAMSGIAFGTASDYVTLSAGDHQIQVVDAGMTPTNVTPILSVTETLGAAGHHTFAISGLKAAAQPTLFRDESQPAADKSHLRVVQLSSDTAAIDAGRKGDKALVTDLAYGHDSAYFPLDAGSFDLSVRGTGESKNLVEVDPLKLAGATSYSAYLVGSSTGAAGAQPLSVVLVTDASAG